LAFNQGDLVQEFYQAQKAAASSLRNYPKGHRYRKVGLNTLYTVLLRQIETHLNTGELDSVLELLKHLEELKRSQNTIEVDALYLEGVRTYVAFLKGDSNAELRLEKIRSQLTLGKRSQKSRKSLNLILQKSQISGEKKKNKKVHKKRTSEKF